MYLCQYNELFNPVGLKSATSSSVKLLRDLLYPTQTKPITDLGVKAATARKKKLAGTYEPWGIDPLPSPKTAPEFRNLKRKKFKEDF